MGVIQLANEAKNVAVADRPPQKSAPASEDPYGDPVAYLRGKGWRCLGNPEWPTARWVDPEQAPAAHYTTEKIVVRKMVNRPHRDPATGKEVMRLVEEEQHIMAQDGSGGPPVPAYRAVFHPQVTPVAMEVALLTQMDREAAEAAANDRQRRRAGA
jgi:hypothetical protein